MGLRARCKALSQLNRAAAEYQSGSGTTAFKQQKVLRRSRQLVKSCALAIHLLRNMQHRNTGQARRQIDKYERYMHTRESICLLVTKRTPVVTNSALWLHGIFTGLLNTTNNDHFPEQHQPAGLCTGDAMRKSVQGTCRYFTHHKFKIPHKTDNLISYTDFTEHPPRLAPLGL